MALPLDPAILRREAATQSVSEITQYLLETLGPQIVAYLSGLNETGTVHQWATGTAPEDLPALRLRHAYQAARLLVNAYGEEMTKTWFFGTNDHLGDEAPAYVLRHATGSEDMRPVVPAADAFIGIAP